MLGLQQALFMVLSSPFVILGIIQSFSLRDSVFAPWFNRPYKGPECVVRVIGVDLSVRPNKFDLFSKTDISVTCSHNGRERSTQIEGNTYEPRFLWSAKMPYKESRGFIFTVLDNNVIERDSIVGRAFIPPETAKEMMSNKEPRLLSIGDNIGFVKVQISRAPKALKSKGQKIVPLVEIELLDEE